MMGTNSVMALIFHTQLNYRVRMTTKNLLKLFVATKVSGRIFGKIRGHPPVFDTTRWPWSGIAPI
jgi:hypothetical protein